jgi:peptide/nickel transport system permease protein
MTLVEPGAPTAATGVPEVAAAPEDIGEARPLRADVWRRFKRNRLAMVGLGFLIVLGLIAVFAPLIAPYGMTERASGQFRQPPSADHWFGTDAIGRDLFSRIVYGARVSLRIGSPPRPSRSPSACCSGRWPGSSAVQPTRSSPG